MVANLDLHLHTYLFIHTLMDYLAPPMFDVSNINMWKFRVSMYLKTLGLHVFLAAIKKSYLGNSKHIEANAQALEALRSTLNKESVSYTHLTLPTIYSV